jgi:hypothetical protein
MKASCNSQTKLVCAAEKGPLRYNLPVIPKPSRAVFRLRDTARAVGQARSQCAVMTSAGAAQPALGL